jgi:two-component system, NtrC family, sensor kinase
MELSFNSLIELYKLASLGKVTGGLIHNINGPLQNIGLDLEMTQYMLKKDAEAGGGKESNILPRLRRIEEELERLNTMIKTSSNRITHTDNGFLSFNDYLEQELFFLNTNLYYKHNVQTTFDLSDQPPLISSLPENSVLAFGWLLQKVIEEIERAKESTLHIRAIKNDGFYEITIVTRLNDLVRTIDDMLQKTDFLSDRLRAPDNESGLMLILKIFHSDGIIIKAGKGQSADIVICFPL